MADYRVKRSEFTESLPEIIELVADAWVEAANPAKRRRVLDAASRGQRLLLAYHWYWDDVTNGGHWQYFWNYTGNLWPEALEAARELRLADAKILSDALILFPDKQPGHTLRERRQQLAAIDRTKFDRFDDRFAATRGNDKKIRQFIDGHPDDFFLPPESR